MSRSAVLTFKVPPEWKGSIASFLRNRLQFSRGLLRSLKKENGIQIDGETFPAWHLLYGGEHLELHLLLKDQNINPEPLPLSIIYEDQDLVIIDKPAGMLVHPVKKTQSGTIANALLYQWQSIGEASSFHPVHRLDRLTSGLVLIAKNPWIHQQLSLQLDSGKVSRLYLAFCKGNFPKISGRIDAPIKEQPDTPLRIIDPEGKPARTRFRLLRKTEYSALLAVKLYTGRTHQIRVHFAHLGYPLWGDSLYGTSDSGLSRTALHAISLSFIHPRSGRKIKVKSELPAELKMLAAEMNTTYG